MAQVIQVTGAARALLVLAALLPLVLSFKVGTWERCKDLHGSDPQVQVVAPNQPPNNEIISLELTECNGNELKARDFNVNLPNLKHIYLSGNQLKSVDPSVFNAFPKITHLFLSNNSLTTVPVIKGDSVLTNLKALFLSDNRLTALQDSETFSSMKHLELLVLANNLIEHINPAVFQGLQNLETIYLSWNKLTYIPDKMFAIPSLSYVSLEENQIEYVAPGAFHGTKLEYLFLHHNKLTHLPEHIVSELTSTGGELRYFVFYNNPFSCACLFELLAEVRQLSTCDYLPSYFNDPKSPQCVLADDTQCKRMTEAEYFSRHSIKNTEL